MFTSKQNVAAVFEWVIALFFTFYVLTFLVDLLPAARDTQMQTNLERLNMRDVEDGNGNGVLNGTADGANGHYKPPHDF